MAYVTTPKAIPYNVPLSFPILAVINELITKVIITNISDVIFINSLFIIPVFTIRLHMRQMSTKNNDTQINSPRIKTFIFITKTPCLKYIKYLFARGLNYSFNRNLIMHLNLHELCQRCQ